MIVSDREMISNHDPITPSLANLTENVGFLISIKYHLNMSQKMYLIQGRVMSHFSFEYDQCDS